MSEPQPQAGQQQTPEPPAAEKPPWGDDANFDPKKAWALIEGLRADKERLSARKTLTDEQEQQLAEYEKLRQQNLTDQQRQAEELSRWQTEAETWRQNAIGSRIEALAAVDFADPSDAVTALADKVPQFLTAGGQIREDAIKAELAAVLERKPHWRRQDGATPPVPRVPAPNPGQGSGGGTPAADPAAAFAAVLQGQLNGPG